jgi:hypothetical protein
MIDQEPCSPTIKLMPTADIDFSRVPAPPASRAYNLVEMINEAKQIFPTNPARQAFRAVAHMEAVYSGDTT